ncbi:translocation/assembly module TamB domain-containing protein [Alteromonas sp. S167]|uniref:translocation/assembly module TamB domain-containing protein n=1 Tax=Alteromonas sp. S167 TaxID=3117402 RepID=UPI002FE360CC
MKKRTISALLLSPVFIVVALYALLISPLGGPTVKVLANTFVKPLHIERIDGSFADALEITGLSWKDAQWQVSVGTIYADLTWRCFFEPRVCVNELSVDDASIKQVAETPEAIQEDTTDATFTMPLPVEVEALALNNIDVSLLAVSISVKALELYDFEADDAIELETFAAQNIAVTLPQTSEEPASPAPSPKTPNTGLPASYSLQYTAPTLQSIATPIPLSIGTFLIEGFSFSQGSTTEQLDVIALTDAHFKETDVGVDDIKIVHEQGSVQGRFSANLTNNYPLTAKLTAQTQLDTQPQKLNVNAKGALDDLAVNIVAEGAVTANSSLSTNILDDTLPIEFSASWNEQAIPLMADATLHEGALTLDGVMGDYVLKGNGAATLADIGKVPVSLDVVLKKNNIFVNEANVQALEGSLKNSGTLYLNDAIAWEGKTTLTNVSAKRFSKYAPSNVNGDVESILQYSRQNGLHISLRDLNVSGDLQNKRIDVKGNAVYSGPSDLIVTNVSIKQDTNAIKAIAQVLNKRHLNADINIDVAQIESLFPDVSGKIKGNVKAVGPWQNPSAKGEIDLTNVLISAALSPEAAQQGAINGSVNFAGEYTDHTASLDLRLPEHTLKTDLTGAWANNHWNGQISNTTLKLANMYWTLSNAFSVNIGTEPVTAKIGQHCWTSRKEGELCVSNVNYQDNRAKWDISANVLPVGLWANELVPHIVSAPSDATLTIKTQGQYAPNDPIDATFTASLSPAPWQLGEERPLTLTINSVETSGKIKQGKLEATSLISSKEIGDATLTIATRPFEDKKPLEGTLTLQQLDVAPLKPLSPAIRTLTGVLNGEIVLAGTVSEPALTGEMTISNGAIDIQDTPVTLADWNQSIVLNQQTAKLDGTFVLGGGKGELTGDIDWSSTPSANFSLKGNAFEVRQPNVRLKVSPNIEIAATKERVDVKGDVNIPWARIEIESLPESAVSPSKDVHLRGEPDREEPLDIVHASVMVNIDKAKTQEVKLEAFGLTASLHGGIRVNTQPALVGFGDLQILNGRYNAYGQQLIIQTGEVQFNGPIDQPLLLVEAIRDPAKTDDNVIAGIRIDGAADAPSINLFSEPAMDQQGVLSYLLTGSGPNSGTQDPNYAALLLGFGLSNTKTLTGQVGSALGIDDFSLSTNENRLSVTGQINDRLSVEYNVDVGLSNNDANATLRRRQLPPDLALKYKLLPSLYLEAIQTTLEDQSEFALDLYYEFFLGDNRTPSQEDNGEDKSDSKRDEKASDADSPKD